MLVPGDAFFGILVDWGDRDPRGALVALVLPLFVPPGDGTLQNRRNVYGTKRRHLELGWIIVLIASLEDACLPIF